MKKMILVFAVLAGILITGCTSPSGTPPGNIQVSFSGLTASGSPVTTKLTLTFSQAVAGLTASDIALNAGSTGAQKGALNSTAVAGVYELTVNNVTAGGLVTVSVSKSGYDFSPSSRNVTVNFSAGNVCDVCGNEPCTCPTGNVCDVCGNDPCTCPTGNVCDVCGNDPCTCPTGNVCDVCGNDPCTCPAGNEQNIGIGSPSVKLFLNGNPVQGQSTQLVQGTGTYTVSIASGTYTEIIWYLNGNVAANGASKTSVVLSKQITGTYHITVEATPLGGIKNSGSHSFVVQ